MSYCVNCGVELDASAKKCALCNTVVINPGELKKMSAITPFPVEKGQVETVNRKDMGILLSVFVLAAAATCGLLNAFVFSGTLWSLAVIGVCVILWVIMIPAVIYTRQPIYLSLLFDGAAVALYLYMLALMIDKDAWLWGLGFPIVVLVTVIAELLTFSIRKLPRSFLTVAFYFITAIAFLCVGLEMLIDRYGTGGIQLSWSAIVLTICAVLDITIITMLSRRGLRNAVRRRLHF